MVDETPKGYDRNAETMNICPHLIIKSDEYSIDDMVIESDCITTPEMVRCNYEMFFHCSLKKYENSDQYDLCQQAERKCVGDHNNSGDRDEIDACPDELSGYDYVRRLWSSDVQDCELKRQADAQSKSS